MIDEFNIEAVDAHQGGTLVAQTARGVARQERVSFEVLVGPPVAIPPGTATRRFPPRPRGELSGFCDVS